MTSSSRVWMVLAGLFFVWPFSALAITLHVTDDADVRIRTKTTHEHSKHSERDSDHDSSDGDTVSVRHSRHGKQWLGFVKFDVSFLAPDIPIERAMLRMWISKLRQPGLLNIHEVLEDWQEGRLRAKNLPPFAPAFHTLPIGKSDEEEFVTVDVTTTVQGWLDSPATNFGIAFASDDTDPLHVEFDSKENRRTSHPMEIEITLTPGVGPEGLPGERGPVGPQGPVGIAGPPGPQGIPGPIGPLGLPGTPGLPGGDGAPGAPGQNGTMWFTGAEFPPDELGNVGEFYLESDTGNYFEKTDLSVWALVGNLHGPKGIQGIQGPQGLQGNPGESGPPGTQGLAGSQGIPGPPGPVLLLGQSCPSGEFVSGFDALGNIICAPPPTSPPTGPGGVNDANPGDVIITEIMGNPDVVNDSAGEWVELFNTRADTVRIDGWIIQDGGGSHTISASTPILIPSGEFLVLGNNSNIATNGGISVDYQYSGITLNNGGDSLTLSDVNGEEIDLVNYGQVSFTIPPAGISLNLDEGHFNGNDNDNGGFWCSSTLPIGPALDFGTPGTTNQLCSSVP